MEKWRNYRLDQSPFYKIKSPAQLANVLKMPLDELEQLLACSINYHVFNIRQNGKERTVEEPKARLQALHRRVHYLLCCIEVPDYLQSAVKGRSYLTNARQHTRQGSLVNVDVRSFFRSVKRGAVLRFFSEQMLCTLDVAGMLGKLLTIERHLPTGSSASPILSYYAYKGMFDEINALAVTCGLRMTCYVDDMSISGSGATRRLLYEVKRIISRHGLKSHKAHYFALCWPKVVTGVVITDSRLKLPNRRHQLINEQHLTLLASTDPCERLVILRELVSRVYETAQIDAAWLPKAKALSAIKRQTEAEIRDLPSQV